MTVGERIKNLREEQNLSQSDLAERLKVTRQTVSQYERSSSVPNLSSIEKIAKALNVTVSDLYPGTFTTATDTIAKTTTDAQIKSMKNSIIGERIKLLRKEKNLTQMQLGDKLGIQQQNIGQYESGKRNPKVEILERIAEALDVGLYDLIPDDDYLNPKNNDKTGFDKASGNCYEELTIEDMCGRVSLALAELNSEGVKKVFDYVDDMLQIKKYKKNADE